jgi:nitrogen regulatory protein P-II 2
LLRKVRLDITVNKEFIEPTIAATTKRSGPAWVPVGDGKIFVLDLVDCLRISSEERGETAID